jgi:histone H2A
MAPPAKSGGGGKSKSGIQAGTGQGAGQTPRTISTRSQKAGLQVWGIAPHLKLPL